MEQVWYARAITDALADVGAVENGLTSAEALQRLQSEGENALPEIQPDSPLIIFLRQFQSPLIYLLLAASVIVMVTGEITDGLIILAVLLFNAIIGSMQEGRAQDTLRALKRYVETSATVLRDGREILVPDRQIVPGDILLLHEGEKVPADARLLTAYTLKVDESSLTGESEPVKKNPETIERENVSLPDQINMVFKGSNVVSGNARAVVVATGERTVIGKIARDISAIDADVPLKATIKRISNLIIMFVVIVSIVLVSIGLHTGHDIIELVATAVTLAVSVIPEGLPIVMTLVLAGGVWRMSKRNALVKKLQAVEALGQANVIALDKTGTITKNELLVREVWTPEGVFAVGGSGYEAKGTVELEGKVIDPANHPELLFAGKAAVLLSTARISYADDEKKWHVAGDATEAAMQVFGEKVGFQKEDLLNESPLVAEMPFDYALGYHAAVYGEHGKDVLYVAGTPETLLALAAKIRHGGRDVAFTKDEKAQVGAVLEEMLERGLRVIAYAVDRDGEVSLDSGTPHNLTLAGFLGMQDTIRPEVAAAMARAHDAGVRVVMITGDHAIAARAIAAEAGIWHEGSDVMTGEDIDRLSDEDLAARLLRVSVFARVDPAHKLRIIRAYRSRGAIVAMTGDGVNDAPSLVAADLGVAMGVGGTEVAKEAADIVLLDDNFGSIVSAIEEGRGIYQTMKKVMLYLFSTALGELLTILGALFLAYPLPILPAQIIWLNFITDGFLDVSLAMEPKDKRLLSHGFAHPKRYIVDIGMTLRMVFMAIPMVIGTLAVYVAYAAHGDMVKASTVALTTLAIFQWFNAWNSRSERDSVFSNLFSNPYLIGATGTVIVLQLLAVYTPLLQTLLHTTSLSLYDWGVCVAIAFSVVVLEELRKFMWRLFDHIRPFSRMFAGPKPEVEVL